VILSKTPLSGAETGFFYFGPLRFCQFKKERFSRSFPLIPGVM
jgi:hypothetical protein